MTGQEKLPDGLECCFKALAKAVFSEEGTVYFHRTFISFDGSDRTRVITRYANMAMEKGGDIAAIEITEQTTLADYFVIATGSSNTQINALCGSVEKLLEEQAGEKPLRREGYRDGTWVLLDYGCICVHVFSAEARSFYDLERLWADGKPLDLTGVLTQD